MLNPQDRSRDEQLESVFARLRSEREIMSSWPEQTAPLVSIYCVTYSHRPFIVDALVGFLSQQTTFPFEILIHDDASTDGTASVILEFERRYPKLFRAVYQTSNQYTKGIKASTFLTPLIRSKYIALCEGDDYWTDITKLQKQVFALEASPQFVMSYHDYKMIDAVGNVTVKSCLKGRGRDLSGDELISGKHRGIKIHNSTVAFLWSAMPEDPIETGGLPHGDRVRRSLLGVSGGAHYLPDIGPSAYRKHIGGVFTGAARDLQRTNSMSTRLGVHRYFRRVGNDHAAALAWDDFLRVAVQRLSFRDVGYLVLSWVLWRVRRLVKPLSREEK